MALQVNISAILQKNVIFTEIFWNFTLLLQKYAILPTLPFQNTFSGAFPFRHATLSFMRSRNFCTPGILKDLKILHKISVHSITEDFGRRHEIQESPRQETQSRVADTQHIATTPDGVACM